MRLRCSSRVRRAAAVALGPAAVLSGLSGLPVAPTASAAPPLTAPRVTATTRTSASVSAVAGGAALVAATPPRPFTTRTVAAIPRPWAMAFLPDGRALVTQKSGALRILRPSTGRSLVVAGTPRVSSAGHGGLADVALAPSFRKDETVYLSWSEQTPRGTRGVVGTAFLRSAGTKPRLAKLRAIWHQDLAPGAQHYSLRLAVSPDKRYLFVSSGERHLGAPAQNLRTDLGKILRLRLDGRPAAGNPFASRGGVSAEIWSYGHRNALGLAFDGAGRLWESEMGPKGGDEINLIRRGGNYGWPTASNGSNYDGSPIPDHRAGDGFVAPKAWWNPSISPGNLMIYSGRAFPQWKGDALVGGLSGQCLIRVHLVGTTARIAERWPMGTRIREVEQGPDGAVWLLEDGPRGRVMRLTPTR